MATLNTITAPTGVPVTVQELKDRLRLTTTSEDARLYALLEAATKWAEEYTHLKIMPQVVELTLDRFPSWGFNLDVHPIRSVDSVKYDDTSSPQVETTLTADVDYETDIVTTKGRIESLGGWPSVSSDMNAVRIRMSVGYASALVVPEGIKEGIKMYAAGLYTCDVATKKGAESALWVYRVTA